MFSDVPRMQVTMQHLDMAKERLDLFGIVGVTEDYGGFMQLLQKRLGWHFDLSEQSRNAHWKSKAEMELQDQPRNLKTIRELNKFDVLLYEYAKNLYLRYVLVREL